MVSFESDYNCGMLPQILQRMSETNDVQTSGYGIDPFTESAKARIRQAIGIPDADIFLLVGGTQTNATMIDALLTGCEGVLCPETAHIAVHEAGAVEASGHKVITLPTSESKLAPETLCAYMDKFLADETACHMVQPGMVYITMPTEHGEIYTRCELETLYAACRRYGLPLYIDGARIGYGLMSDACDYDLPFLAAHCDAFYIGGTKCGAIMGEAAVFSNMRAPRHFFTTVKRHGALLAKGRILGLQFDTLFTDGLYFKAARHANEMAARVREIFAGAGIPLAVDSPTNQQFFRMTRRQREALLRDVKFEVWDTLGPDHFICRFVTGWATTDADIEELRAAVEALADNRG